MNRKLVLLLIPLMLLPMAGFGYAHWTDKVTKQIKLHAGTVEVEIIQFHVDECNSYDVSCDDVIWIVGEYPITDTTLNPHYDPDVTYELIIEKTYDEDDQLIEIYITADPVYPGWRLEFKMLIHNKGRLSVRSLFVNWNWTGPLVDEPDWLVDQPYPNDRNVPICLLPPLGKYEETQWLHDDVAFPDCPSPCTDKSHYTVGSPETTAVLKPSKCLMVKEVIWFDCQEHQEEIQCHWFRLAKEIGFYQYTPDEPWSSVGEDDQGTSGP